MDAPSNLIPLPTMPYDERPDSLPLDTEECRTALFECSGNVTAAANLLKVAPSRLRAFVKASAYLTREANEFREQIVDKAEMVIMEALDNEDQKFTMARFVASSLGKTRGYNQNSATGKEKMEPFVVEWGDGETIDAEVAK